MKHELKIKPEYLAAIYFGEKTFEIRNNSDRNFQVGDTLLLRGWDGEFTGDFVEKVVSYITDFEQQPGYVVLGLVNHREHELLEKFHRTGVAIERAISAGAVLADHPLKSRLELLANHHKREQALADGMVAMADRCQLLAFLLREATEWMEDHPAMPDSSRMRAALAGNLPSPAVTVTETIRTAPERIWLQVGDQSHYHSEPFPIDTSEVSWCADSVMACEVPYVRADLAGKLSDHHEQHPDDAAVDRFAAAMKTKLAAAREKGRGGWDDPATCSVEYLADLLVDHVGKGNAGTFEDVANFAMMLHQRGAEPAVLASAATVTTCATCSGHGMIGGVTGQTPESMDFREAGCPDCNGRGKVKVKTHTITEGGEFESKILRWAQALTEGEEFELVTRLQTIARGASADPASAALVLLNRIDSDVDWLDDPHQLPPRQGGELCDSATPSFSPA